MSNSRQRIAHLLDLLQEAGIEGEIRIPINTLQTEEKPAAPMPVPAIPQTIEAETIPVKPKPTPKQTPKKRWGPQREKVYKFLLSNQGHEFTSAEVMKRLGVSAANKPRFRQALCNLADAGQISKAGKKYFIP